MASPAPKTDLPPPERRERLLDSAVGSVVDLRRRTPAGVPPLAGVTAAFQVCLPYSGFLVWHVGGEEVPADANQLLFVKGGESYRVTEPLPGGFGELLLVPGPEILAEITHGQGPSLAQHPLFRRRSVRASPAVLALRTRLLHRLASPAAAEMQLGTEEMLLELLRLALAQGTSQAVNSGATTTRLIRRTKEVLAAELGNRVLLADIARAVGASPAYLTDAFRRLEGVSLHRYLTELRLARAVTELPHADDLTRLAFDSGFSSHSHFTAAFRRAFGQTPSEFRGEVRGGARPV